MANPRQFDLEDIVNRPGTYFNPQTEVLIVVDDSPDVDTEIFNLEDFEGADWVLISDESPIDESRPRRAHAGLPGPPRRRPQRRPRSDDEIVDDDENAEPEADEVEEL